MVDDSRQVGSLGSFDEVDHFTNFNDRVNEDIFEHMESHHYWDGGGRSGDYSLTHYANELTTSQKAAAIKLAAMNGLYFESRWEELDTFALAWETVTPDDFIDPLFPEIIYENDMEPLVFDGENSLPAMFVFGNFNHPELAKDPDLAHVFDQVVGTNDRWHDEDYIAVARTDEDVQSVSTLFKTCTQYAAETRSAIAISDEFNHRVYVEDAIALDNDFKQSEYWHEYIQTTSAGQEKIKPPVKQKKDSPTLNQDVSIKQPGLVTSKDKSKTRSK